MTFQISDFKNIMKFDRVKKNNKSTEIFSVIINNSNKSEIQHNIGKYSVCNAIKPFIWFSLLCGTTLFQYSRNKIEKVSKLSKLYNFIMIFVFIIVIVTLKPRSWSYTEADTPLHILTILFGFLNYIEIFGIIFFVKFWNDENNVKLFLVMEALDHHLGFKNKMIFIIIRTVAIIMSLIPALQFLSILCMGKFHINNIGVQVSFFLLMVQGSTIALIILNLYVRLVTFIGLLDYKINKYVPNIEECGNNNCRTKVDLRYCMNE